APAALAHAGDDERAQLPGRPRVDVDGLHEDIARRVLAVDVEGARGGGVVHEDLDRGAERIARGVDDAAAVERRVGEVGGDRDGGAAGLADLGDGLVERTWERVLARVRRPARDADRRALGGEPAGDRPADATARAGDDRRPSLEDPGSGHAGILANESGPASGRQP